MKNKIKWYLIENKDIQNKLVAITSRVDNFVGLSANLTYFIDKLGTISSPMWKKHYFNSFIHAFVVLILYMIGRK